MHWRNIYTYCIYVWVVIMDLETIVKPFVLTFPPIQYLPIFEQSEAWYALFLSSMLDYTRQYFKQKNEAVEYQTIRGEKYQNLNLQ